MVRKIRLIKKAEHAPLAMPARRRLIRVRPKATLSVPEAQIDKELAIEGLVRSLRAEIMTLKDPALQDQWREAMENVSKDGDMTLMLNLSQYKRRVVDLEEFLFSGTYMNMNRSELYPGVLQALHDLDGDQYVEAVFKGAIGGGKSTVANIGIPRTLYKMSCMRNPQQTFGVQQRSSLVFTIQSVRLSTAKKAVFQELGKYINDSPYFNEIYPYDKRIKSEMIFRQQNVVLLPVSSGSTGAISMNVIGGVLDEMNFMAKVNKSKNNASDDEGTYDQAKSLYEILSRRRRSRFMSHGKLPGMLYLISSSRYPDDFTEIKALESTMLGGPDEKIYVWSKSLWESKGRHRYKPEEFKVLIGDERNRSRILADDEVIPENVEILTVPEDFRAEFVKDPNGSIRDFGGRTTLASRPFIHNREALQDAMNLADQFGYDNAIPDQEVDLSNYTPTVIETRLRTDVKQMRVAHVDLAKTRDSAGLAVGHIAGMRTIERRNAESGNITIEVLPIIAYDVILRINPPRDGEINFAKIRQILYDLRDNHGLPIKVVTTDGFESTDFRQILASKRFVTDYVSMDRTVQPYRTLRDAIYDGRILLPRHNHLVKELVELEYKRLGAKDMIDHRDKGSKDVADAVCGVASYLITRRSAWTSQPKYQGGNGILLHGNRTNIGKVRLETITEKEMETIYVNGRAVIQTRQQPERRGIIKRK